MADYQKEKAAAEAIITARRKTRDALPSDARSAVALEAIADDLTMLRLEMSTIREILAIVAAKR